MPNINDAFPSQFLKASDLKGMEVTVAIDRVDYEPVGRDKEMKAVLYFQGKAKGLVLNKTNATKIVQLTASPVTEEWEGFKLKLYPTETQYGGDTVDCIRIKAATNGKPVTKPAPAVDHGEPVHDDEVPF